MTSARRVLGVDPGTRVTGWGVVERKPSGLALVAYGTVRPPVDSTPAQRLRLVHQGLLAVLAEHAPQAVALEEAFFGRNVRSAIRLAEARAVCLLAAELSGCPVHELPPALIKKGVTGSGQASKESVRRAVLAQLGWEGDRPPPYDASDALAGAICTLQRMGTPGHLVSGSSLGRRRKRSRRWTATDVARVLGEETDL